MLALNFLGVSFAWAVLVGVQMPGVGTPMIRVVPRQSEGLEQRFELQKDVVFTATKDVGQDRAGVVIGWHARASGGCLCARQTTTSHPSPPPLHPRAPRPRPPQQDSACAAARYSPTP